ISTLILAFAACATAVYGAESQRGLFPIDDGTDIFNELFANQQQAICEPSFTSDQCTGSEGVSVSTDVKLFGDLFCSQTITIEDGATFDCNHFLIRSVAGTVFQISTGAKLLNCDLDHNLQGTASTGVQMANGAATAKNIFYEGLGRAFVIQDGAADVSLAGISGTSYSQAVVIDANGGDTTSETNTITIEGARFMERTDTQCIVVAANNHQFFLKDAMIANCGLENIRVDKSRRTELDGVVSANAGLDGAFFKGFNSQVVVRNSKFVRNGSNGVTVDDTKLTITLVDSQLHSNGNNGVNIVKARGVTITSVEANNNANSGIFADARNFFNLNNVLTVGNTVAGVVLDATQNSLRFNPNQLVTINNPTGILVRGTKTVRATFVNTITCESDTGLVFETDVSFQSETVNVKFDNCLADDTLILDVDGNTLGCTDVRDDFCDEVCGTTSGKR
ncbi:MAG: hypothetical protein SGILL_005930, partial [Bacillariaceae sp.]